MHHPHPSLSFSVDSHDFDHRVLAASHDKPVLVDFWADWCAPCIHLAPILDRAVVEFQDRLLFAKVEVDEGDNMRLAGHFRLKGFPTVIIFRDGIEQERFAGSKPLQFVRHFIERHV